MAQFAALLGNRWVQLLAIAAIVIAGVYLYGEMKFREGVRETTVDFLERDLEGAAEVRESAREILDSIGDDFDPVELLRSTGGLRDEPGDLPPTE